MEASSRLALFFVNDVNVYIAEGEFFELSDNLDLVHTLFRFYLHFVYSLFTLYLHFVHKKSIDI